MRRSATERQFEILGEALNRALKSDPALIDQLPEAQGVIGFRNVLAHAYDDVIDDTVLSVANTQLPALIDRLESLLKDLS